MCLSRRVLWLVLWAASACVGGPISDLPHSGDDESTPPRPGDANNTMDAGLSSGAKDDAGDSGADAGDASLPLRLPDGGVASGPAQQGTDPCEDVER